MNFIFHMVWNNFSGPIFGELFNPIELAPRDRKARAGTDRATRKMHGNKNKREKARRLYTDPYM